MWSPKYTEYTCYYSSTAVLQYSREHLFLPSYSVTCQWPCLTALNKGTIPRRLGWATAAPCSRSRRQTSNLPLPAAAVRAEEIKDWLEKMITDSQSTLRRTEIEKKKERKENGMASGYGSQNFSKTSLLEATSGEWIILLTLIKVFSFVPLQEFPFLSTADN